MSKTDSATLGRPQGAPPEALLDEICVLRTESESLCAEILERYEEATLVYRLCRRLAAVMGSSRIGQIVLGDAARMLCARAGELWLVEDGATALAAVVPHDNLMPWSLSEQGPLSAAKEGQPWVREASPGVEAVVAVPLPGPDREPAGVLVLRGRDGGRSYRSGELKLLTAVAALASAFLRNARLGEEFRLAEQIGRRQRLARHVERCLHPGEDPARPGLDVASGWRVSRDVSADYYGYLTMADGSLGLAIAGAGGHGVGAALPMAAVKGTVQSEARHTDSPADLLQRCHYGLANDFVRVQRFAEVFVARFHPGGRQLDFANAGHNPPLLVREGGRIEPLGAGGVALGAPGEAVCVHGTTPFAPGDVLVMYSDGVVTASDREQNVFGVERLGQVAGACRGQDAASIRDVILAELDEHCGDQAHDDITLVVVRATDVLPSDLSKESAV